MPLKYRITKEDHAGLDESLRGLYAEKDGEFVLAIEGAVPEDEVAGLKAKNDELLAEKKEAARKAKEAEEAAKKAAEEAARKNGDVEALEKSWQEKLQKREAELTAQIEALNGSLTGHLVDSVASSLASELAVTGSAKALAPHIKSRLAVEMRDGKHVTVVRDADGKPSALTLDDLKNEFRSDAAFAPLIVASKAAGGGANGGKGGGKGGADMTTTEKHQLYRENPAEYQRLFGGES